MPGETRTFNWNANAEPDIAGYKLYAGTATGVYNDPGSPHDFGNVLTGQFAPTNADSRFYALTAYNTSELESDFSSEVEFVPRLRVSKSAAAVVAVV